MVAKFSPELTPEMPHKPTMHAESAEVNDNTKFKPSIIA